ncbi:hypothetical protein M758_3G121800 [Ceratodon purpureus]|uniref:Glyoxysomal processing protease, glyoxysomal n=1 Tax=Ceratodon purpureus TaxID=3225 RepID=A0A8T0IIV6_CERPU|nr:hypothetical protein KC19_3G120300 [Ceratodon purpureus]KAG0622768.1 hypothetical protein M758_3G121800 [Ceratodon purpureus]
MAAKAAMDAARLAAVMVRVHGPDPKGRKMRRHAFFHSESGDTTLSASGFLVPCVMNMEKAGSSPGQTAVYETTTSSEPSVVVITCASIVEPFLAPKSHGSSSQEDFPKLIRGAEVDILVEVPDISEKGLGCSGEHSVCWLPGQLLTVVDVPAAGAALQDLLDVHGGSVKGVWEVGWALAPVEDNAQQLHSLLTSEVFTDAQLQEDAASQHGQNNNKKSVAHAVAGVSRLGMAAAAATRIAVLSVGSHGDNSAINTCLKKLHQLSGLSKVSAGHIIAKPKKRGDSLIAVGSPFGALSPLHFQNSVSVGIVSNLWPPTRGPPSLLMADVRCLPGMEGGPVFDEQGNLVGMLTRPLRQRGGAAEVQLVMTTDVLLPVLQRVGITVGVPCGTKLPGVLPQLTGSVALNENSPLQMQPGRIESHPTFQTMQYVPSAVDNAVTSVVLITIGDGAWASGIILNKTGLILTNAHLLEPWRFGKNRIAPSSANESIPQENDSGLRCPHASSEYQEDHSQKGVATSRVSSWPADVAQKNYQRIRVRLDHQQPRSWHAARPIYVSQGPLDIALLQLESPPSDLCPITPEKECPTPGSTAVVLGHGLFGPRSELCLSVSAGVVARVVKAGSSPFFTGLSGRKEGKASKAAMLQTTAAVHPGGSGGAVVNGEGRMIGLVTSNARHSGGTVIPFLNFSVPYAALVPIFEFASRADADWSRLEELDKPNEQLAAVWALVPPTPPRPSPQLVTRRHPSIPVSQETGPEKGTQKGSRFAEFMKEKGGRGWKLPESLPQKPSRRISPPRHYEEPSYAARASYQIHSRL